MKLLFAFAFCLVVFSCRNEPRPLDKINYEQSKENIALNEKNNPLDFLKIIGNGHKNVFGKTITKSVITNYASLYSYTDVRVKMLCYDANANMLEEHEDILTNIIKPLSSIDFKTKYHLPKGVDSIALSIMSATPGDGCGYKAVISL